MQKLLAFSIITIIALSMLSAAVTVRAIQTPVVAVNYYCWFGFQENTGTWTGKVGSSHWDDKPSTTIADNPFEYYSSLSNQTLNYQLTLMQQAGIDVIFASWWGNDYTAPCIANLFKYIQANNIPIKVALMVEPFAGFTFPYAAELAWILFYSQFPNHIFNWQGKPLLTFFESAPVGTDSRYTIRTIANGAVQDYNYVQGMNSTLEDTNMPVWVANYYTNLTVRRDNVVTVTPRFDNYAEYLAGGRADYLRFDANYTLDMYGQEWEYAINNHANMVLITSWNEWTESSELEPHMTNGNYINLIPETAHYTQIFHSQTVATPEFSGYVSNFGIVLLCVSVALVISKRYVRR